MGYRPRFIPLSVFSWTHSSKPCWLYRTCPGRKEWISMLFLPKSLCTLPCLSTSGVDTGDPVTKSRIFLSWSWLLCLHRRVLKKAGVVQPGGVRSVSCSLGREGRFGVWRLQVGCLSCVRTQNTWCGMSKSLFLPKKNFKWSFKVISRVL